VKIDHLKDSLTCSGSMIRRRIGRSKRQGWTILVFRPDVFRTAFSTETPDADDFVWADHMLGLNALLPGSIDFSRSRENISRWCVPGIAQ
jgi:hypothetical protein